MKPFRAKHRVLGPGGNSRDFATADELGQIEFGAIWDGTIG